jgi:hypothetical protein
LTSGGDGGGSRFGTGFQAVDTGGTREVVTMRDRQRLRLHLTIIAAALVAAAPVAYALTMDTLANARELVI